METSTPLHRIGSIMRMPQDEISISPLGESNASSGEDLESVNAEDIMGTERTGLSDKLDGTALTPVKSITESKEEENIYVKVEELTGAAYCTGLIKRSSSEPDIIIPLEKNAFVTNKWKGRRIINNSHYMGRSRSFDSICINLSPWSLEDKLKDMAIREPISKDVMNVIKKIRGGL